MLYLLYKISFFIMRITDTKCSYAIVSFFASLKYYFSKNDRETVEQNLRVAMPEASKKEISVLAKKVFINFGKYLVDFFAFTCDDADIIKKKIVFEGLEKLDRALELGKGCIILTGHFGNWELGGYLMAKLGYKLNIVALDHSDQRINEIFIQRRKKAGINIASIGNAKRFCLAALKRNEIVGIAGDRPYGENGIDINFFGKTARIPRGAALFSIRTGAPLIIVFTHKTDDKNVDNRMVFEGPIPVKRDLPVHAATKEATQYFINRFELYIRKYPAQWYMFHHVWGDEQEKI